MCDKVSSFIGASSESDQTTKAYYATVQLNDSLQTVRVAVQTPDGTKIPEKDVRIADIISATRGQNSIGAYQVTAVKFIKGKRSTVNVAANTLVSSIPDVSHFKMSKIKGAIAKHPRKPVSRNRSHKGDHGFEYYFPYFEYCKKVFDKSFINNLDDTEKHGFHIFGLGLCATLVNHLACHTTDVCLLAL